MGRCPGWRSWCCTWGCPSCCGPSDCPVSYWCSARRPHYRLCGILSRVSALPVLSATGTLSRELRSRFRHDWIRFPNKKMMVVAKKKKKKKKMGGGKKKKKKKKKK